MSNIQQLKQQRETLLQLADQVYAQIQELERKEEKPKVKIGPGDFAFYDGHAYFITKDYYFDEVAGVRFDYNAEGVNKFSWIAPIHCNEFAKFAHLEDSIKIIPRQDCDLSALGL